MSRDKREPQGIDGEAILAELDALPASGPVKKGPRCTVSVAVDKIAKADAAVAARVSAAINDPDVDASALARLLSRHSTPIGAYTVRRHRKRGTPDGCRCPR